MIIRDKPVIEVEVDEQDPVEREEVRKLIELERKQQALLIDLLEEERLPRYVLNQLIDLGFVSQADDLLPCDQSGRLNHPGDYYTRMTRYRERLRNPPPPPPEPLDWMDGWEEEEARHAPGTGGYCCPLVAYATSWDEPPPVPCVEARRRQRAAPGYKDDPQRQALLDDPDDPVNVLQLRPCRVLGNILYDSTLLVVARRKRDAEARRFPTGKPTA